MNENSIQSSVPETKIISLVPPRVVQVVVKTEENQDAFFENIGGKGISVNVKHYLFKMCEQKNPFHATGNFYPNACTIDAEIRVLSGYAKVIVRLAFYVKRIPVNCFLLCFNTWEAARDCCYFFGFGRRFGGFFPEAPAAPD